MPKQNPAQSVSHGNPQETHGNFEEPQLRWKYQSEAHFTNPVFVEAWQKKAIVDRRNYNIGKLLKVI